MHLVRDLGLLDGPDVTVIPPVLIDDDLLLTVHDAEFVAAVRRASVDPDDVDLHRGLGTDDVPTFAGMHEASRAVCGATLAAVQAVHSGAALHAVNLAGGLHHAMPERASGFCVYDDPAVAIAWALEQGGEAKRLYLENFGTPSLVAVLAHVRDPGNAGTVVRAADADHRQRSPRRRFRCRRSGRRSARCRR